MVWAKHGQLLTLSVLSPLPTSEAPLSHTAEGIALPAKDGMGEAGPCGVAAL